MPARNIEAQVREWVDDEARKVSFTDNVGWIVYPTLIMMPNRQQAGRIDRLTHWVVEMTLKTGLMGDLSAVRNLNTITRSDPKEAQVRQTVAKTVEELRQFRGQLLGQQKKATRMVPLQGPIIKGRG